MNKTTTISTLTIAAPPMLEASLGYTEDARLVAFWFGLGDELYFADGQITTVGEWDAANLFFNHPLLVPHLRPYHLGSLEESPTHYLLLDRESRHLSVVPVTEAQRLLHEQWGCEHDGPDPVLVVEADEWDLLVQDLMARLPQTSPAQFVTRWREHQRQVEALAAWLAEKWEEAE